jgi:hypothetical protein
MRFVGFGLFGVILVVAVVLIAVLCWIWMSNTRAYQSRSDEGQRRLLALMAEQNELLKKLVGKS